MMTDELFLSRALAAHRLVNFPTGSSLSRSCAKQSLQRKADPTLLAFWGSEASPEVEEKREPQRLCPNTKDSRSQEKLLVGKEGRWALRLFAWRYGSILGQGGQLQAT